MTKHTKFPHKLSDEDYQKQHPVAFALRAKGFIPLPRLWIKADALPGLKVFTDQFRDEVNDVRRTVYVSLGQTRSSDTDDYGPLPIGLGSDVTDDPRHSINAAWEAYERDQSR